MNNYTLNYIMLMYIKFIFFGDLGKAPNQKNLGLFITGIYSFANIKELRTFPSLNVPKVCSIKHLSSKESSLCRL